MPTHHNNTELIHNTPKLEDFITSHITTPLIDHAMPGDTPTAAEASMQDVLLGNVPMAAYVQQLWDGGVVSNYNMLIMGGVLVCAAGLVATSVWRRRR